MNYLHSIKETLQRYGPGTILSTECFVILRHVSLASYFVPPQRLLNREQHSFLIVLFAWQRINSYEILKC